jgi:hypothetical protein
VKDPVMLQLKAENPASARTPRSGAPPLAENHQPGGTEPPKLRRRLTRVAIVSLLNS